jgi:hypothetical protein
LAQTVSPRPAAGWVAEQVQAAGTKIRVMQPGKGIANV